MQSVAQPSDIDRELRQRDAAQYNRAVDGVVELIGLQHTTGRDRVQHLRYRRGIDSAVRVSTRRSADAELELLRRRLETSRLVRAEAVLAGEHHRERPPRLWRTAQRRLAHRHSDAARD